MLSLRGVSKRFGANAAVDDVDLSAGTGEIVGLVGENGAGKSTLTRIAAGELRADAGTVEAPPNIGVVHQHFAIVPEFTIAENLALLRRDAFRVMTRKSINADAEAIIARSGIELRDVTRRAGDLSVGEKAKLELIKAVAASPRLLILDEPTSVLTPVESDELFSVMRRFAGEGATVVFISHKVREILAIASRVVVMRRGRVVADAPSRSMTAEEVANAMVESPAVASPRNDAPPIGNESLLEVRGLRGEVLRDVDLRVRRGEIAAIAGVAGNGQSELMELLRGLRKARAGSIEIGAKTVAFIPEDRTRDGVIAAMSIAENIALSAKQWSRRSAIERAHDRIDAYGIRSTGPQQMAGDLSGGNQQKVVLARELDRDPDLIVAAEPTRGLDIAAAALVQDVLRQRAANGAGVLLITSDLDEAFALADTVRVMYRGTLSEAMAPAEAAANIGPLMAGIR